ncbi:MAG: LacI family DNA-binding transcriptional regulator [Geminicoccaceae bacterium]
MTAVAKLAGVSIATVSRALSNPERVNARTRERVLRIVRQTGYTPNIAARQLRAARSMTVLVVVPAMVTPFFAELFDGVDRTLSAHGYSLLVGNLLDSPEKERRLVDLAFSGGVDGVILLNGQVPATPERSLTDSHLPTVAISVPSEDTDMPSVLVCEREAGAEVARHLLDLGHKSFGYVAGPEDNYCEVERWHGFSEALQTAGIPPSKIVRLPGDFGVESGEQAALTLCRRPAAARPTAVFSASDMMAIGFMRGLREQGVNVPSDISIVGFDGIVFADYCEPRLTTMKQPKLEMSEAAVELLMQAIKGEALGATERMHRLKATLRIGESTTPPGA